MHDAVTLKDFEAAMERAVAGLEKKTRVMNERERTSVAYHESGHALVAALLPNADPVTKISIVPRTRGALGYTMQAPTEDRYLLSMDELLGPHGRDARRQGCRAGNFRFGQHRGER